MNDSTLSAASSERGFLLVGVIMFMLALTILGLSLFALSSYEAQFFYASASREQSLQSSESGMEVVKALLHAQGKLESAQLAVGQFGITQALAYQARSANPSDTTSRGPVNWDSTLVIVVAARSGGQVRTVQSRFVPVSTKNPYQQLISCGQRIWYNPNSSQDSAPTLELQGSVWEHVQTAADDAWVADVRWTSGGPIDPSTAPTPLGNAFVDARRTGAPSPPGTDPDNSPYIITFDNQASTPAFYRSPPSSHSGGFAERDEYEFFSAPKCTLWVHGTVVWVVGQGACFRHTLTVLPYGANDPDNPNVLVLVAKPNLRDPGRQNVGLWFKGGLIVNDPNTIKVFLVSEGDISFTQANDASVNLDAKAVAMVAGGSVELMGAAKGFTFKVTHAPSMDAIADALLARGALPPTSGGSGSFAFAAHSWLETRLP